MHTHTLALIAIFFCRDIYVKQQKTDFSPLRLCSILCEHTHVSREGARSARQRARVSAHIFTRTLPHMHPIKTIHPHMGDSSSEEDEWRPRKDAKKEDKEETTDFIPFVDWPRFNVFIGAVIISNAFMLGVELDMGNPNLIMSMRAGWYTMEFLFCTIFVAEVTGRIYYHKYRYFSSLMNILDLTLVAVQVVETYVIAFLMKDDDAFGMRVFGVFRVLRMVKLIRLLRLFTIFKQLYQITRTLFESLTVLVWVALLIILVLYIVSVLLTSQVGKNDVLYNPYFAVSDGWDHEEYFGTVQRSMFSLIQILTLSGWSDIARHVKENQPMMLWVFLVFIVVTTYGLISMIIGIIIEHTILQVSRDEHTQTSRFHAERAKIFDCLRIVFETADADQSNTVTMAEVVSAMRNPEIKTKLKQVGFPVSDPAQVFKLLDVDRTGSITVDVFVNGCKNLVGGAKSKDLFEIQYCVEALGKHLGLLDKKFRFALEKIDVLDRKTTKMSAQSSMLLGNPQSRRRWRRGAICPT